MKVNEPMKYLGLREDLDMHGYRARDSKGDPEFLA